MKVFQKLLRWLLLATAETYICLVTIPHALQSMGLARPALLGAAFFVFSIGLGYFLVHSSRELDCWREAAWFGAFIYGAIIVTIAAGTKISFCRRRIYSPWQAAPSADCCAGISLHPAPPKKTEARCRLPTACKCQRKAASRVLAALFFCGT